MVPYVPDRRWLILLVLFLARTALTIQFRVVAPPASAGHVYKILHCVSIADLPIEQNQLNLISC
jgi:hypothetical protein